MISRGGDQDHLPSAVEWVLAYHDTSMAPLGPGHRQVLTSPRPCSVLNG